MPEIHIEPIPALKDNYVWSLEADGKAVVVDPGDAKPVLEHLQRHNLELVAILTTHHHADHVGGVPGLLERWKVPVYGPRNEPIPTLTHPVSGGDTVSIPELGLKFEVLDIPGHTRAHIAYYGHSNKLFCGDTLFACGCGRAFEGPPEQLYSSLQRLAALPEDTLIYCGHEYTVSNIDFAEAVEPGNPALQARRTRERELRAAGRPTVPSTLGREKSTNPFLRCTEPAVIESANKYLGSRIAGPAQVFAALRNWKNSF